LDAAFLWPARCRPPRHAPALCRRRDITAARGGGFAATRWWASRGDVKSAGFGSVACFLCDRLLYRARAAPDV